MNFNTLIIIVLAYALLLFFMAYWADQSHKKNTQIWLQSPWIYTLSLGVYCTAWTFYGAVGSAARNGYEFIAIYIGPSLALFFWWVIIRRILKISKLHNITSIADFISSRFGKSNAIARLATAVVFLATIPYISLQLQSISQSFAVLNPRLEGQANSVLIAGLSTIALAVFAIMFGTRNAYVSERQQGVVTAIAFESIIKLIAITTIGIFALYSVGGIRPLFELDSAQIILNQPVFSQKWFALISLSFMVILVLPRMFHLMIVENSDERHLYIASWGFPLYLFLMNIFVLPIAIVGVHFLGNENPDNFLIILPLFHDQLFLANLAFIGGFSAATSMIIISAIAVANMFSNHFLLPIWIHARGTEKDKDDVRTALIFIRRVSIILILAFSFIYFQSTNSAESLASIGLVAFVGTAQLFPAVIVAVFWRGATGIGVFWGILCGLIIWLYSHVLPILAADYFQNIVDHGIFGITMLRPENLFYSNIEDPLVHALFWSILVNISVMFIGSMLTTPSPVEHFQTNQFIRIFRPSLPSGGLQRAGSVKVEDFLILGQRILGMERAAALIENIATAQGRQGQMPILNDYFMDSFERSIGGMLGGATAHNLISQIAGRAEVPISETIKLVDETIQNIEYAKELEKQSFELEETTQSLRIANSALIALDAQKDAFLSQVSHELRTPMTAIRSFTEILLSTEDLTQDEQKRMLNIIASENLRLTALLDDILDLSFLESGKENMSLSVQNIMDILAHSENITEPVWREAGLNLTIYQPLEIIEGYCHFDRLSQVFINLITNAAKYVDAKSPHLEIHIKQSSERVIIDFIDNGKGIDENLKSQIFEKFVRGGRDEIAGSAGLGLAISKEIMLKMHGQLRLIASKSGAHFQVEIMKSIHDFPTDFPENLPQSDI